MKIYTDDELRELLNTDLFHLIGSVADEEGLECYVVGGYVRDIFLQRPSKDIDVVVVGSGIRMAEAVKKRLGRKAHLAVYRNFGTAQITVPEHCHALKDEKTDDSHNTRNTTHAQIPSGGADGRFELEFVGARRESYQRDSRKPIVEDGTLEDDQNRRDFTINAMAICLNSNRFGQLVDPFDGIYDLEDGIIRTPLDPDITFSDDPLRMLRCVRFATQLGFYIEDETFEALKRNAERLKIISGERISDELNKIIMAPHPSTGFDYLHRAGLLQLILPELCALDIVETRNGRAHKNNYYHTLEVLENVIAKGAHSNLHHQATAPDSSDADEKKVAGLWLRWAALLHDIGKPRSKRWDPAQGWTFHNHNFIGAKMVPEIFRRLKLPMDQKMKYVQKLVDLHMRPIVIADEEVTDSAVRRLMNDAGDDIEDLMRLCEADITSKNQQRKQQFLDNFRLVREKLALIREKDWRRELQPVIDGNEIMEMFHLSQGPMVGQLKACLKDAVLDNRVPNEREPLLQLLKQKAQTLGLL